MIAWWAGKQYDKAIILKKELEKKEAENAYHNQKLKESEELFRLLTEYSSDMITLHDSEGKFLYTSPACKKVMKYEKEEMIGQDAYLFIHPHDHEIIKKQHQELLDTGYTTSTYRMRRKDGEYIWFESSLRVLQERDTKDHKLIVVSRNINDRKLTEQKLKEANEILQHLSSIDGLTGVKNRRSFDEYLEIEWHRAIANSAPVSLIMVDLDHFKPYNDTYGHQAGDECLKEVANAIEHSLRRLGDSAFRYGGEEFSVILPDCDEEGAYVVAENIRLAIETLKITHSGSKVSDHITLSLGTATMAPSDYYQMNNLVNNADKALYQAKQDGGNRTRSYERKVNIS
nr:diguanylate cyclase [Texcoconibacillus texcoconensis]